MQARRNYCAFSLLEKKVDNHGSPAVINAVFVDGNYQLRLLPPDIPPTFGGLSASILNSVLAYGAQRTDVVSDTLESGWIKECERERRGADAVRYTMSGPDQIRPKDLDKALKSPSFKEQLPQFLMRDWAEQHHAQALSGRELYLGVQGECARFTVVNGYVKKDIIEDLACNHSEADSRLCLHLHQYNRNNAVDGHNTVVRCSNTDILVILIHHVHRMKTNVRIETGTAGRSDRRYVDVTAIADSMGPKMCAALPAFHAYTGCDYTAAFIRKGKKRPFALLEKDHQAQTAFEQLCTEPQSVAEDTLFNFTAAIYSSKKTTQLNEHRFRVFEKAYEPKDIEKPLEKLKGVDSSSIPPCESEVKMKIARTAFVARYWHTAHLNYVTKEPESGWELVDGSYRFIWFDGNQIPDTVVPETVEELESDSDEDERRAEIDDMSEEDDDYDD